MFREYPALKDVPTLVGDMRNITRPGDVLIVPDIRTDACQSLKSAPWVNVYTYILSINLLPALMRAASRRPPAGVADRIGRSEGAFR